MRRQTQTLAYGSALLSFCTLGAVYFFAAMVPSKSTEPPLPHTQQRTSELLFFIPYGEQDSEIYIEPATGPGEGDGIWQTTPVAFRRLADGNFMIVGGREGGLTAQVFDRNGKLVLISGSSCCTVGACVLRIASSRWRASGVCPPASSTASSTKWWTASVRWSSGSSWRSIVYSQRW
jgi:hypothetical protein